MLKYSVNESDCAITSRWTCLCWEASFVRDNRQGTDDFIGRTIAAGDCAGNGAAEA